MVCYVYIVGSYIYVSFRVLFKAVFLDGLISISSFEIVFLITSQVTAVGTHFEILNDIS